MGLDRLVSIVPTLMEFKTENYKYDKRDNVVGWDEIREWKVEITKYAKNSRQYRDYPQLRYRLLDIAV